MLLHLCDELLPTFEFPGHNSGQIMNRAGRSIRFIAVPKKQPNKQYIQDRKTVSITQKWSSLGQMPKIADRPRLDLLLRQWLFNNNN